MMRYPRQCRPTCSGTPRQRGNAVALALLALVTIGIMALIGSTMLAPISGGEQRANAKIATSKILAQAAYNLANESNVAGGYAVASAFQVASPAPTGGGQIPVGSSAPKTDAWGTALGYCTATAAAENSAVFAVISAGANKTFDTTCANALAGTTTGDDVIVVKLASHIKQAVNGTVYQGPPLANLAAITAIAAPKAGEQHGAMDTGNLYINLTGTSGASNWTQMGGTVGPINSLTQANCTASNGGVAGVWGTTLIASGGCDWNYTTPGTYTWTALLGVANVSVVCVGGGAGGGYSDYSYSPGGGGGALAYSNTLSLAQGQTVTVTVGAGGVASTITSPDYTGTGGNDGVGGDGGTSSFGTYVFAYGGFKTGAGGAFGVNSNGGNGGSSSPGYTDGDTYTVEFGGGGAGGYGGPGGNAGYDYAKAGYSSITFGGSGGSTGGGAGGGSNCSGIGVGGGGVGIYGMGTSGAAPVGPCTTFGGYAGSGGTNGSVDPKNGGAGGNYGGGGGASSWYDGTSSTTGGVGGIGACRIIYPGNLRLFPSTLVGTP